MIKEPRQLRILILAAGWAVVLTFAFLCGCESKEARKAREAREEKEAEAYYEEAEAHYEAVRWEEAITAYKKAVALKPDYAEAHFGMGFVYFRMGRGLMLDDHIEAMARYKRGIAAFESAVALKPDYAEAYCYMGDCYRFYLDCKRDPPYDEGPDYYNAHREGGAAYKKAIALKPDYIRAYYGMAHFCGSLERITIYKKIVAIKPDEATAYLFMGFAYTELGRHADAITVYKKAIEQDDATAYFYMGKAYENIEQYPEAIVAYKKYIALGPTAYFSGVASERIEELSTTQPAD